MKTALICILVIGGLLIGSGCKKKKDEEPKPFATFTIAGIAATYNYATSFGKICLLSRYCASFSKDQNDATKNHIQIGVPEGVHSGAVYYTGDSNFYFLYLDPSGNTYSSYYGKNMTVTITSWGGNGNWAEGTFAGSLPRESNPGPDSVIIQNGSFKAKIWYIE